MATFSLLTWQWSTYPFDFSSNPYTRHSLLLTTIPINNGYTSECVISSSRLTAALNPNELLQQKLPPYYGYFTSPIAQFPLSHSEVNKTPITKAKRLKLQNKMNDAINNKDDFKSDVGLLRAVQQVNPEFVIEEISPVANQHILTTTTSERTSKPIKLLVSPTPSPHLGEAFPKFSEKNIRRNELKVEATGKTATSGTTPQIPFGTYFLPYLSKDRNYGSKTSALILEPHSKAVVGNGGTAVSTPISRAFLKRGVPTNVYFNPESVAIAGVGGKAHAQADLELDLVDSRY